MMQDDDEFEVDDELDAEAPDDEMEVLKLSNESALVYASGAVWSPEDSQLVAAHVVTTSHELLTAIRATLANNSSKSFLTLTHPSGREILQGARRGFITVTSSLDKAHAAGVTAVLLHPLTGDPKHQPSAECFYVVAVDGEDFAGKFGERLALAIPWPTRPEWAQYLIEAGQEMELVEFLPVAGRGFTAAARIARDEAAWATVIADGLKHKRIII